MQTKTIKQEVKINAKPSEVYEALMDSGKHSEFTRASASISKKVNGKISAYDGYIDGKNIELVKGKKIVQKWRGSDWPEGHYSVAKFELKNDKGKTRLVFTQTGVPKEHYKSIADGWKEHYWDKMKKFLKNRKEKKK